jgi:DNA-binding response OmpR family regulator
MALRRSGVVVAEQAGGRENLMSNEGPEGKEAEAKEAPSTSDGPQAGRRLGGARADFVAGLGRKVSEMRAVLSALEADPRASGPRDELRRKLHALGAAARLLHFDAMAASIGDAEGLLERAARGGPANAYELGRIGQTLDDLPALAWGEGPPEAAPPEPSVQNLPAAGISALVVGGPALADALTGEDGAESIFECERTEHAQAALGLARALAPDVVVVDAEVKGALDLVESLLDDPLTEPVPIIVLGNFSGPDQAARFVALGVAKVLAKPVAPGTLRRACHEVIDQREGRTMPMTLGEPTVEQLGQRLAEEMRRALVDSVDATARSVRVPLGEGAEVVGALWGAIARVREVITMRTDGAVRYSGDGPEGAVAMAPWLHPEVPASDRLGPGDRGRGAAAEVSLDRRVVIVADDDPGVTWFISDLLRTTGCVVHEALDGTQALKLAWELSPELVISDILMPGLDGFALCRALRRDVALGDTPVILLSWKEDLLQRVRELGASAAAYLRKESDARSIVARVREVLRPRARVEARLRGDGEVRGRLDGLTVHSLLRLVSSLRPSSRVIVRDASFLYEVDFHAGSPRRATRTATDGTFQHGERVLAALLGVGAGRFVVTPLPGDMRPPAAGELEGTLEAQLARPVAHARAALAATTGSNTMHVERVVIDEEMVKGYLLATPEPARSLVLGIARGESPRNLILRGDVSPSVLEDVLADLAARGAIVGVQGGSGQDLLRTVVGERKSSPPVKERPGPARPSPSPLPASDLVARELPAVRDAGARRSRPASPSSLEDAVIRAMSEGSPSKPPPSSEQPPIIEPSELRPRSSNPPAGAPERALPSIPPDAIVPATSSGEVPVAEVSAPASLDVQTVKTVQASPLVSTAQRGAGDKADAAASPNWMMSAILLGALALVVVGGMRWFSSSSDEPPKEVSGASSDPDVAYGDIPAEVSVPDGQGLLEIALPAGASYRIDGAESSVAPPGGRVRVPAAAGTHMIHAGPTGAERSRLVQVRAGRMAHVTIDGV